MKTSLWLAALPLAFSAPLSGTPALEMAPLSKRGVSFGANPVATGGDQCGATDFKLASSGRAALRADCNSLVSGLRGKNQHWELDNNGGSGKWLSLASAGTCHFWIDRSGFQDSTVGAPTLVGTDDVADIVQDAVARFQNEGIPLQLGGVTNLWTVKPAQGTAQCHFNDAGKVPWRIQLDKP